MNRNRLQMGFFLLGILVPIFLIGATISDPPPAGAVLPGLIFLFLIVFTNTFSVPLGPGLVSLLPMVTIAGFLVTGPVVAGWAAFLGAWIYAWLRYRFARPLQLARYPTLREAATIGTVNAAMQSAGILAGALLYQAAGGIIPLAEAKLSAIWPLSLVSLGYLLVNHLIAGLYIAVLHRARWANYLRSLPHLVLYELLPVVFAPLMALVYTRLGLVQLLVLAVALVITSLITRDLALARQRLQRRIQELDSLQAVGQVLSASLDQGQILEAVYAQAANLMPALSFYVALYDSEVDEVSFPLALEDGQRVRWRSRRTGGGLTEHILRTATPLLIRGKMDQAMAGLGLQQIGRPAGSFLGVPMMAGQEALGVIAVQSAQEHEYDSNHQEVLATIAAQAAIAIQNARLYARTDEALARRVQELNSILRTTQEGILLLDPGWRVLAANRALASFLGLAQLELAGSDLHQARPGSGTPLVELIGYSPSGLQGDCQSLIEGGEDSKKVRFVTPGPPERYVERTLTPVRDQAERIVGWLVVLRDLTEERELARLREEMTHMLIHDLRSPLTVISGSLDMLRMVLEESPSEGWEKLLGMARQGSERMLEMVNSLLGVSRLESGQMPLHPEPVGAQPLLQEVASRLAPLANEAQITVEIACEENLAPLYVDRALIDRVLSNLLDNAIKFTPDRGRIKLWAKPDPEASKPTALVGVTDTGPGIPPADRERVFDKFQQVASIEGRRRGTGLGLALCKLAVEAHGGRIWVESQPGEGSTFLMRLPLTA